MNYYLQKYGFTGARLTSKLQKNTFLIIIIPSYGEDELLDTLRSLDACDLPKGKVEVIIVFNASKIDPHIIHKKNIKTYNECKGWNSERKNPQINYEFIIENNLPLKHAGVGLARKIGMDEAIYRLESIGKSDAVLVCLDGDTLVARNYLFEIERVFRDDPKLNGVSIHFEHPLEGLKFKPDIYSGITQYELHLRYYNLAMKYTGFPFAHHTIGSAMAIRSDVYQKQGGMNKRKAGEDFYFLHKIIPLGSFIDLYSTEVYPSPRISDKVPFGTGRAQLNWTNNKETKLLTYSFQCFIDLKKFFDRVPRFYFSDRVEIENEISLLPNSVVKFLGDSFFLDRMEEIKRNVAGYNAFLNRFFKWFDAFRVLKFVHFCRDNFYRNIFVQEAAKDLLIYLGEKEIPNVDQALLQKFRLIEKTK